MATKIEPEFVWAKWRDDQTPANAGLLLDSFRPMIHKEVNRQKGTLPQSFLEVEGKRLAFDAFNNYDPDRGRLSTYVGSRLKGLSRANYTYQNTLRMPEAQQRKFSTFMSARHALTERLGRDPSVAELSDDLAWSTSDVASMEKNIHHEIPEFKSTAMVGAAPAWSSDDAVVDYLYHDMMPEEKIIFEAITGYKGHPILSVKDLAMKLRMSESQIRRRRDKLVEKIEALTS